MRVYIYDRECVDAGLPVPNHILEQTGNPDACVGWTLYEGDKRALRAMAMEVARAGGPFRRQVAKTLLAAVGLSERQISQLIYGPPDELQQRWQSLPPAEEALEEDDEDSNTCLIDDPAMGIAELLVPCGEEDADWS